MLHTKICLTCFFFLLKYCSVQKTKFELWAILLARQKHVRAKLCRRASKFSKMLETINQPANFLLKLHDNVSGRSGWSHQILIGFSFLLFSFSFRTEFLYMSLRLLDSTVHSDFHMYQHMYCCGNLSCRGSTEHQLTRHVPYWFNRILYDLNWPIKRYCFWSSFGHMEFDVMNPIIIFSTSLKNLAKI